MPETRWRIFADRRTTDGGIVTMEVDERVDGGEWHFVTDYHMTTRFAIDFVDQLQAAAVHAAAGDYVPRNAEIRRRPHER